MKRIAILLATGLLVGSGSMARADDEEIKPVALHLAPAATCAVESHCDAARCGSQCSKHSGRCLDWLFYRPPSCHCACTCVVSPCTPPVYMWFLDYCQGAGCAGGCGHAAVVPAIPLQMNAAASAPSDVPAEH